MPDNIYAAPAATLSDISYPSDAQRPFFAVSTFKLVVMMIFTLNLYSLLWFYRNWHAIKAREGSDVIPVLRAVFSIFFAYGVFRRVRDEARERGITPLPLAGPLTALWICPVFAGLLPLPYSMLFGFVGVLALLPIQACVNRINAAVAPDLDPNASFTGWNWFGIIVGALALISQVASIFYLMKVMAE